jgi:CelD/BcsL family acetyltransferase involved in cellulose biosynthesis
MPRVYVSLCSHHLEIVEQWEALALRASPNVFMHPAALNAVHATKFAKTHVLLAWDGSTEPHKLIGLWALQECTMARFGPAYLAAPPYDYAFVSSPVADPARIDDVTRAFFDAIERHPTLPKVIRLKYLDGESETYASILKTLTERGSRTLKLSERQRPFVSGAPGLKHSGSTRKKLRQDWNRLSALCSVAIANDRERDKVEEAFEVFLALEAESWKGGRGTALLCRDDDATFTRRLVSNLAAARNASVALLRVDGRPIAAQVLLYCGRTAYTWKTAFDAAYAKYSPGVQLVDRMTEQLLATDIEAIDSCSPDGSFMARLWTGRRTTTDLLVDVGAGGSLAFTAMAMGVQGYAQLRVLRNALRSVSWRPHRNRKGLAASA